MDLRGFKSLAARNPLSRAIIKKISEKTRKIKYNPKYKKEAIDIDHLRRGIEFKSFSRDEYLEFWKDLADVGAGKLVRGEEGLHNMFVPSIDLVEFAKQAMNEMPASPEQDRYNRANPASTSTEGPVFVLASEIMKASLSDKEIKFLVNLLNSKAQLN